MLGTSLNIKNQSGVLSVLAGTVDLKDAVYHHKEHGFDVLIGGTSSANPADVFSSDRFCEFVRDARKIYDIIIFDAPPVLLVPDARIIGQSVDAVLFVVLWDKTKKHQVRDGISQLTSVGVKITGLVLSNINPKGMKRYGHGDRYGAYSPSMAKRYYRP
jgi:Mrp family chromosome partitioning ATPase